MKRIRKFVAFGVGAILMLANQYFDFSAPLGFDETLVNLILTLITGAGVYQFKNEE